MRRLISSTSPIDDTACIPIGIPIYIYIYILFLFYVRYSGATPFFIFNNLYIMTSYFLSF